MWSNTRGVFSGLHPTIQIPGELHEQVALISMTANFPRVKNEGSSFI